MPTFTRTAPTRGHDERRGFSMFQLLAAIGIVALSMTVCLPAIPDHRVAAEDERPINIHAFRCRAASTGTDAELTMREILVELDMTCLYFVAVEDGWFEFSVTTDPSHTNEESLSRIRRQLPAHVGIEVL